MDIVEVKNFSKSFGTKAVHRDVSFHVKKGECLGLLGGSGAGKSVILRSLIGLEKPDTGEIWIDQVEITQLSEKQLLPIRKKVAYAFQGGALFDSMSVYENLAYPLRNHMNLSETEMSWRISKMLADFGLSGQEKFFPNDLSGGMQKRLGLARAMMLEPDVLLYDEPTAGLDPANTHRIQEIILQLKMRGVTSLFVSHDMTTALEVCDRIVLLGNGRIVASGTPEELGNDTQNLIQKFIKGEAF